jgi:hypothetical protein
MIKSLHTIIRTRNPNLEMAINKTEDGLSITNGEIQVHTVENLFEIRYLNYIHYTESQSDVIHIIFNNI